MKLIIRLPYWGVLILFGVLAVLWAPEAGAASGAITATLTTIHSFAGPPTEGSLPIVGLALGSDGNFYGTCNQGGAYGPGVVFKITPAGGQTTLYSFTGNADGAYPHAGLSLGSDGNFYGATWNGGDMSVGDGLGYGTVFKITPAGNLTTLHQFTNGADGANPTSPPIQGSDGYLYGTASDNNEGDPDNGYGSVYKMTSSGSLSTLYTFNPVTEPDGAYPSANLVQGSDGNFYGTTLQAGASGNGIVFKITPSGSETILHAFGYTDGSNPTGALVIGNDGNFYGTTLTGGAHVNGTGGGTVFKITPSGGFTLLYSFNPSSSADGYEPLAGLVKGSGGNFYGTTAAGGVNGAGTVFVITPSGALTYLHSFSAVNGSYENSDGANPFGGLVQVSDGSFYGTTMDGGSAGKGTVFKLTVAGIGPSAGSMYSLWWNSSINTASLWNIPASGSTATASFGPYTGWTPAALASDTSGNAYILWTTTTGAASVWQVSSSLKVTTSQSFGPYAGWTAKSMAVGPDGNVHVLWNHTADNEASIFNIVPGSSSTSQAYGPFLGWQATHIAVDSNNNTRLLWTDTAANEASLWNITSGGMQTSQTFGPYSGWQAQSLAVGSDNLARILWENTSTKQASIHTVSTSGSVTSLPFGAYSGWTPTGLAVNNDGDSDLTWTNSANQLSIFDIGSTGSFTSSAFGPYSGWKAIAIAPGP